MKGERIRRGGTSNRLSVKDAPRAARQVKKAAGKSAIGRSLARLPISPEAMQRGMTWGIVALCLAARHRRCAQSQKRDPVHRRTVA